jgi:hypothetical protein
MHFELIKAGTSDGTFIKPDSGHSPMDELLERWGQAKIHAH